MTWLVALGLLVGACYIGMLMHRRTARGAERATRPYALLAAELVYMEETFRIGAPIRLVAKVDRAYRLPDGTLVLVELKSRWSHAARATDVIQLSAQKLALEGSTGLRVAPYAYVSTIRPCGTSALRHHRAPLLDAAAVVALARRRNAVLEGQSPPKGPDTEKVCETCAFRSMCPRWPPRRPGRVGE